jgi:hypothetical protein
VEYSLHPHRKINCGHSPKEIFATATTDAPEIYAVTTIDDPET